MGIGESGTAVPAGTAFLYSGKVWEKYTESIFDVPRGTGVPS